MDKLPAAILDMAEPLIGARPAASSAVAREDAIRLGAARPSPSTAPGLRSEGVVSPRAAVLAALAAIAMSGCSAHRISPAALEACRRPSVDPAALRADVVALTTQFEPRDFDHPQNLDLAAAFLAERLRTTGATVSEQAYRVGNPEFRNVLAELGPDTPERIVIGAHYDTAGAQPGADDDASGIAALLALARLLAASPPPLRVELAAYTLEEPPAFATDDMGSAVHARALAARGAKVRTMIAVEMVGAFSDGEGTQHYPAVVGWFYPSTGNFVAVVGKWGQGGTVRDVAAALRAGGALPVETLTAPTFVTGVDFSDHRNFWTHGYPAVMVTDTSFYRNDRYHTKADTAETLDFVRMAEVVKGLYCAVQAAARR